MKGLDVFQENNYDRESYFNTLKCEKNIRIVLDVLVKLNTVKTIFMGKKFQIA